MILIKENIGLRIIQVVEQVKANKYKGLAKPIKYITFRSLIILSNVIVA